MNSAYMFSIVHFLRTDHGSHDRACCWRGAQVRRRRQADGETVQVLEPEAQRLGPGIHTLEGKFVRDGAIPAAEWALASAYFGATTCPSVNQDMQRIAYSVAMDI